METVTVSNGLWEQAKANHNAACVRVAQAGSAHTVKELEEQAFDRTAPAREIAYTASGFTIPGKMTLCPQQRVEQITVDNYGNPSIPAEVTEKAEYAAFGVGREAWLEQREALCEQRGWDAIEQEWDEAVDGQMAAIRALIACPVSTVAEVREKLSIALESREVLNEDELRMLAVVVAADLRRISEGEA